MTLFPKISVIVPVYNVEKYIERCIQSLLNQTYNNLEILLIDDGSSDKSGTICDEYELIDKRIRAIHKPNGGVSESRNKGIDIATGDYLAFVDSDDFLHPEMYETLYRNISEINADISICAFTNVYDSNSPADENPEKIYLASNVEALGMFFTFDVVKMTVVWNKLYKKELFDEIRFPEGKVREDEVFSYQIIFKAEIISISTRCLYYYFQRDDSLIHVIKPENELLLCDAFEGKIRFFKENNLSGLYELALRRYCMWLVFTGYTYQKKFSDNNAFKVNFKNRRIKSIDLLLNGIRLSHLSRMVFRLSKEHPHLPGLLANQKLNHNNFLSRIAECFFDDHRSMVPEYQ